MKLYMPVKVYQEKRCVENHSRELAALGTKALIVTGKHSSRINGSLDDVKNALEREGVPYTVLSSTGILLNIPDDLYEAARIDGANPYAMFAKITFPYMTFVLGPSLISTFVGNINNFNINIIK